MRHLPHGSHHHNAKAIISFLILLVAVSLLLIFYTNQEIILDGEKFNLFMTLAVIGSGLLIGLLYLVNNSKEHHKVHAVKTKGGKAKKKKSA